MKNREAGNVYEALALLDAENILEKVSKSFRLSGATMDVDARRESVVSTGLLVTDLLLNGGIHPGGWYTFFGPEQSAKSTNMLVTMVNLLYSDVPVVMFHDAEGSNSPDYVMNIADALNKSRGNDHQSMFGVRDPKKGTWVVAPRIRYYNEHILETVWGSVASVLRGLPDKIYDDGEWWLLYERTKENISRFKGGAHDKKMSERYNKLAVRSVDGGTPQALFLVDSYPSLVPSGDDDEEGDKSLSLDARLHAKHVKKIKGRLKSKHSAVVGVNQLRDNPGAAMRGGSTEYEPGGNALKFYSDVRVSHRPRGVPHASKYSRYEEEDSVLGEGMDQYRYILMYTVKNKFGAGNIEAYQRIWTSDPMGRAMGVCPVWDTYEYLKRTGQVEGDRRALQVKLPDLDLPKVNWLKFKGLVLLKGGDLRDHCASLGLDENPKIRKRCFDQLASGDGLDLFFDHLSVNKKG